MNGRKARERGERKEIENPSRESLLIKVREDMSWEGDFELPGRITEYSIDTVLYTTGDGGGRGRIGVGYLLS